MRHHLLRQVGQETTLHFFVQSCLSHLLRSIGKMPNLLIKLKEAFEAGKI